MEFIDDRESFSFYSLIEKIYIHILIFVQFKARDFNIFNLFKKNFTLLNTHKF